MALNFYDYHKYYYPDRFPVLQYMPRDYMHGDYWPVVYGQETYQARRRRMIDAPSFFRSGEAGGSNDEKD